MMKKTFFLTILAMLTISAQAADTAYQYLVFTLSDGTTKAVTATNLNIAFDNGNLTATNGSETLATIPLMSLTKMEFSTDGTTAIEGISVDQLVTDDNTVIYDLQGREIQNGNLSNGKLPRGTYILKNGNKTLKVNIR